MYGRLAKEYSNLRGVKNTFQDTPLAKQFKDAAPHCQASCPAQTPIPVLWRHLWTHSQGSEGGTHTHTHTHTHTVVAAPATSGAPSSSA